MPVEMLRSRIALPAAFVRTLKLLIETLATSSAFLGVADTFGSVLSAVLVSVFGDAVSVAPATATLVRWRVQARLVLVHGGVTSRR
jgi:hypothetical protein